jgi:sporulation integral membrane protein YtvI
VIPLHPYAGRSLRALWVLLWVAAAWFALTHVVPLIFPFLIAWLIAYLIRPAARFLTEKTRIPKWLAIILLLLLIVLLLFSIAAVIIAQAVVELSKLNAQLPHYIDDLQQYFNQYIQQGIINQWVNQITLFYYNLSPDFQAKISETIGQGVKTLADSSKNMAGSVIGMVTGFLAALPGTATMLVIAMLAAFFICNDWDKLAERINKLFSRRIKTSIGIILVDIRKALLGFAKAQLILVSTTALIMMIGLLILRVKYAITIGLLTGLVDLLPYLGTGSIMVPWIIYAFFVKNYTLTIGLSILYAVVLIVRQLMEPRVMATTVGLDPLAALIALFVGLKLFGFIGIIIGPVSIVLFNALNRARVFKDIYRYIMGTKPKA